MSQSKLEQLIATNPGEAQKLLEKLATRHVVPHEAQRAVLSSKARFRVMNCGRRFGKTKIAAKIALQEVRKPDNLVWWVAPTYKVVKRGYREILRQLEPATLSKPAPSDTLFDSGRPVILHFKNGAKMEFYSAERPESMLGEGVDFAVLDEAAMMNANIWEQVVRPTLMDRKGGGLMLSTPRGKNWFYRAWKRGQGDDTEWQSWTFPSWANTTLPEGEIDDMKDELPAVLYAQEVEAAFVASGSNVFVIPDEVIRPKARPKGHVVLGIDLAKTADYTVIYGANSSTRENCYFERFQDVTWPKQRRRIVRVTKNLLKQGASGITICMDSTGVGDPMVDELEELGYDVIGLNFSTYKDKMVRLLAKDIEDGKAFLLEDYLHEFEEYLLDQTAKGRVTYSAPVGSHDDVVSAKMLQHWCIVNEGVPGATVIDGISVTPVQRTLENELPEDDDDQNYYVDISDEEYAVDGVETVHIVQRSAQEMLNDPAVWL